MHDEQESYKQMGSVSVLLWMWTGGVYFFMEVAWETFQGRPETISWTMFALAIFLAIPLERFGAELSWDMPLVIQAIICTCGITAAEVVAGLIINVWLGMGVWDYSAMPGNVMGQICLQFIGLWLILSHVGIIMLDWLRYVVEGGERPHYTFV